MTTPDTIITDLAKLEALTIRLRSPGGETVRKVVHHDERGKIAEVVEEHQPNSLVAIGAAANELILRLNAHKFASVADASRYATAYGAFARAAAACDIDEPSKLQAIAQAETMEAELTRLARQPGGHPDA